MTMIATYLSPMSYNNENSNLAPRRRPPSREDYFIRRRSIDLHGRLGSGGQKPKLVGCEILDLSESGAVVEPYAPVDETAQYFTLEFNGQYRRAKLVKSEARQLLLAFFNEELDYIEAQ
jgi:hypothetical protein